MPSSVPFLSVVADLLIPPASLAWLALGALMLPARLRPRLLSTLIVVLLYLLGTPLVSGALLSSLSAAAAPGAPVDPPPGAIVILSGDVDRIPPPEMQQVGALTLEREKTGAALARATGLPVLVTGGVIGGPLPLGVMMTVSMFRDFGVPVRWTESRSGTTWENAEFSAPLLKAAGIGRVYLVTHAWHMRRSALAFRRFGIDAVSAPVQAYLPFRWEWAGLLPRSSGWMHSYYAMHEYVGLFFYWLRR